MIKAYKYRIYPTTEQQKLMKQFFGCSRFIYNKCLEWYNEAYRQYKENNVQIGKLPLITVFKQQHVFLKKCDNAALAYARSNFEKALSDFFKSRKGQRKGKRVGFPTFKSKNKSKMTYRTCDAHGGIRFNDDNTYIRLPKLSFVKCKKHRDFNGVIKAVTVECKPSGKYYVSLTVECGDENNGMVVNKRNNINSLKVVGLDMSMSNFVVSSESEDNTITKYVRQYRKNERKLKRMQRVLSRRKIVDTGETVFSKKWGKDVPKLERSKNREKARLKLARLYEHIANCRKDFISKTALYYARKYDVIVLEDINMQDMARCLNFGKSVNDLGFGLFRTELESKCKEYDCCVVYVDKWFASSKTCSECGSVNSGLRLSDREWVCPECGCIHDRDINASLNLRNYFTDKILNTAGTAGIQASGETSSTLRETLSQVVSLNEEAPSFRWG